MKTTLTYIRTSLVVIFIVLFSNAISQNPGSPFIDAGNDQVIACNGTVVLSMSLSNFCNDSLSYAVDGIPYAPLFPFNIGIVLPSYNDDVWSSIISLPFNFCFFDSAYSHLLIGANGVISFDTINKAGYCPWLFSALCPSDSLIKNAVFGVYHDLDIGVSGFIRYTTYGVAPNRTFVANWYQVALFSCNTMIATHQIVLYESTNVIEVYVQTAPLCPTWNGGKKLIGIQDHTGNRGFTPPGRNTGPWSATNEAWRFTPCVSGDVSVAWFEGGNMISDSLTVEVSPQVNTTYVATCSFVNCFGDTVILSDTVNVFVFDYLPLSIDPDYPEICFGDSITIVVSGGSQYTWSHDTITTPSITVSPSTTTTYTVSASDDIDCTGSASVVVTVHNIDNTVDYLNGTLTSNQGSASYQWVDCNANFSHIQLDASYQSYTPLINGEYAVIIYYHDCIDTSDCYLVPDVGMYDLSVNNYFEVFPNPNDGAFFVKIETPYLSAEALLTIFSMTGQKIYESILTEKTNFISPSLIPGSYILKIQTDQEVFTKKLIIF